MKKALELSVNFLVVLIISLVLFGMGVKLTYDIYTGSKDIEDITEKDIHRQIGELQCRGSDRVCFGINSIEVERGDVGYFGVKVTNVLDAEDAVKFGMEVLPYKVIRNGDSEDFGTSEMGIKFEEEVELNSNDQYTLGIAVSPASNAPSGIYSIEAKVTCEAPPGSDTETQAMCDSYGADLLRIKVP